MPTDKHRCFGNNSKLYRDYHDTEWGIPVYDEKKLFELLILEGAQAGLNWETILKKREGYRRAFHGFDPQIVAKMKDEELESLRTCPDIIRNKLKIFSARKNAQAFLNIQKEFGSFSTYYWAFPHKKPIINHWNHPKDVPSATPLSEKISYDLKKRGMTFVGPTIIYAFMQATGMVNDHLMSCWRYGKTP